MEADGCILKYVCKPMDEFQHVAEHGPSIWVDTHTLSLARSLTHTCVDVYLQTVAELGPPIQFRQCFWWDEKQSYVGERASGMSVIVSFCCIYSR